MIVFKVLPYGIAWQVTRNDRLVSFFDTRENAISAAEKFVSNIAAQGQQARLVSPYLTTLIAASEQP